MDVAAQDLGDRVALLIQGIEDDYLVAHIQQGRS